VVAGKLVRLAVERHVRDLEDGLGRGLEFNEGEACRALHFIESYCQHSKGEWAGQPFILAPWQCFLVWVLFGWFGPDGTRRFRIAYVEIARKNGKSTLAAAIGLYLTIADGEPGAEVYSAATKRDQARIVHREAVRMVKRSRRLQKWAQTFRDNIVVLRTDSKYEPLGADADTMDGLNIHGAVVDELHAHKTRDAWDVLNTATGARRQPLIFAITTAGYDRTSICWEVREYCAQVLRGEVVDDEHFAYIATIDEGDDWRDESCWPKANPNLGLSAKLADLRRKARVAKRVPSFLNDFLRRHLDVWTSQDTTLIPMLQWDACPAFPLGADFATPPLAGTMVAFDDQDKFWRDCRPLRNGKGLTGEQVLFLAREYFKGRTCYGGLDLSSSLDLSAFVLAFPGTGADGRFYYDLLCRFWLPERNMEDRAHRDGVAYPDWIRRGLIETTPGATLDYGTIMARILEDARDYDLREIAFDPFIATKLVQDLQAYNLEMVEMRPHFSSMSAGTKEFVALVADGRLRHGANPVLRWMADHVVAEMDHAGNMRPNKAKSTKRIDGVVAGIMALDRATRHSGGKRSVYEDRGVRTL
jgi:phage terminase large subunit-like protein